ncbi:TPA: hypothetical protein JAN90_02390 [Legionella pneumophila]|nr:hypothetical protein [Legionella pneumophila]HAT8868583.1 hypothetical protein [Legionella pneumophila subsp. pneumophila]HAT7071641.1 hypothetical protein [Legionella pneumophila]HAT8641820.1 hypothetical protein [Legionella pneumophila]HAT8889802.1 hypothetical protein [Legionella pneumophila subsp. pneumophila]HAT8931929.1 hypothetical protein [Legionella pneumophila subsp. pneumophila]
MGENSRASTHNGDIRVTFAPKSVQLDTSNGNIYENGIKRKKDKTHHQGTTIISGNGMSIINGRFFVNGKDITDIVNNATNNSKEEKQEEPIRYTKQ